MAAKNDLEDGASGFSDLDGGALSRQSSITSGRTLLNEWAPVSRRSSWKEDPAYTAEKQLRKRSDAIADDASGTPHPNTPFLHSGPEVIRGETPPQSTINHLPLTLVPFTFTPLMGRITEEPEEEPAVMVKDLASGGYLQACEAQMGLSSFASDLITPHGTPRETDHPRYMGVEGE